MMKTVVLSFIALFICISSFAQKDMDDVVYLKNGSKIKGVILQLYPDSIVQIKQAGGSIWIFPMNEVSMIAKEDPIRLKATINDDKGFQFGVEGGFLIGSGNNESYKAPLSIQVLGSYRVTPWFAAGVGTGLDFFRTTQAPVFLDLRLYNNRQYYATYLFVQGGAMFPVGNKETSFDGTKYKGEPGFMVNPGIGFLFPLSERSAFSLSFSYRYHELKSSRETPLTEFTRIERMNRFNLKIGFLLR